MIKGVRLEKVDDHTLRVYVEKGDTVPIQQILNNRQRLADDIKEKERVLASGEIEKQLRDNIVKLQADIKENETLLENKDEEKKLQQEIDLEKQTIANIDEMLAEAKAIGVEPIPENNELKPQIKNCGNCYYTEDEPICLHPETKGEITEDFVCDNWKPKEEPK